MSEPEAPVKNQVGDRIAQLQREVAYHSYRYHVLDDPVVSDA